jgi:hypothetical protein
MTARLKPCRPKVELSSRMFSQLFAVLERLLDEVRGFGAGFFGVVNRYLG